MRGRPLCGVICLTRQWLARQKDQTAFSINLQAYLHFWIFPHMELSSGPCNTLSIIFGYSFKKKTIVLLNKAASCAPGRSKCIFNRTENIFVLLNIPSYEIARLSLAILWPTFSNIAKHVICITRQWLAERSNCIFVFQLACNYMYVCLNILLFYKLFDCLLNLAIHWATFVDRNIFSFNRGIKKSGRVVEGKG